MDSREKLVKLLEQCETDTRETLGHQQAKLLAHWRNHQDRLNDLVWYVQQRLHGKAKTNGFLLDQEGKLSLERIVIDHCPELFGPADIAVAKETLGVP